ncbi:MAG: hypothetical protein K2Y32_11950 [Candidatus Obscuribacterales bacterium]|nr:hypothetical protein [Candidatus Obscuribacterales bacterium]
MRKAKQPYLNRLFFCQLLWRQLFLLCLSLYACRAVQASENLFDEALTAYKGGMYSRARNSLELYLRKKPLDQSANYLMGCILLKQNCHDLAKSRFEYCQKLNPKSAAGKLSTQALQIMQSPPGSNNLMNLPSLPHSAPVTDSLTREQRLREESARLNKEAEEKIAVKKRVLEDQIHDLNLQEEQALRNLMPVRRRFGGSYVNQEARNAVKKEFDERRDALRTAHEEEADQIRRQYQDRIEAYEDTLESIESRKVHRRN